MFEYENIKEMSKNDVLIMQELATLVSQAEEAEKQIKKAYLFRIGEDVITVWSDEHNHENITHDGIWQARYLHQTYDVKCTAEEIFEYMKANFLIEKGYAKDYVDQQITPEGEKAEVFRYFKTFLNSTIDKNNSQN